MMIQLKDKVVIITGASGALGQATASVFAQADASLVLTGRDLNKLAALSNHLTGTNSTIKDCDLCDQSQARQLAQFALDQFGRIDALLNIAGGFAMGPPVHELGDEDFRLMFDINFVSTLNTCKAVIPAMITQGEGRIINVSARAASQGKSKMAPYCIAKRAVITLTESLAAEHRHDNININCILPGTIDTAANRASMANADFNTWVPCEDLANTMLYLSSPLADSVHGAIIPVYGKS